MEILAGNIMPGLRNVLERTMTEARTQRKDKGRKVDERNSEASQWTGKAKAAVLAMEITHSAL